MAFFVSLYQFYNLISVTSSNACLSSFLLSTKNLGPSEVNLAFRNFSKIQVQLWKLSGFVYSLKHGIIRNKNNVTEKKD